MVLGPAIPSIVMPISDWNASTARLVGTILPVLVNLEAIGLQRVLQGLNARALAADLHRGASTQVGQL